MKAIAIAAALVIGGCEVARTVAPHTTAGFEQGGVLGAVGGASGALLATCRSLDGEVMRVAVDDLGLATGTAGEIAAVRAARQRACAAAGALYVISDGLGEPPVATVHRATPDVTGDATTDYATD